MDEDFTLEELLRQGGAAARLGETEYAREYFTRATEQDPTSAEAWLGLGGAVEQLSEKQACFERVLDLYPDNAEAQAGLEWIRRKEGSVSAERPAADTLYCSYHPQVQTALRCNRCGKPICPKCAVLTEVGYRCPDCIRTQQSAFFNIRWSDYPVALLVGGTVAGLAALLLGRVGLFISLLLSPVVGGLIAELVHLAIGRRRGRYIWLAVGSAVVAGGLFGSAISGLLLGRANPIALLIFFVLATGTAVGRLR